MGGVTGAIARGVTAKGAPRLEKKNLVESYQKCFTCLIPKYLISNIKNYKVELKVLSKHRPKINEMNRKISLLVSR